MKRFLITFLVLLLIAAIAFVVFCYVIGSKDAAFAVLYEGIPLDEFDDSVAISAQEPLVLEIVGKGDYAIRVVPAPEANVTYTVSGQTVSLKDADDLSDCFESVRGENSLTIVPKSSLSNMLTIHHNGETVVLSDVDFNQDLFTIVILCGETEYRLNFGLKIYEVTDITIQPGKLVF